MHAHVFFHKTSIDSFTHVMSSAHIGIAPFVLVFVRVVIYYFNFIRSYIQYYYTTGGMPGYIKYSNCNAVLLRINTPAHRGLLSI